MATRKERVLLELEDRFSQGMAAAAAKTALLNRELNTMNQHSDKTGPNLDRNAKSADNFSASLGKLNTQIGDTNKKSEGLAKRALPRIGRQAQENGKQIDKLSGRLGLLAEAAITLGPALVPIGAVAVPAITGLAMSFGVAAGAAGTAVLAFQGVGNALKAIDAARIEPTAANLAKMRGEFDKLGPDGAKFARYLSDLEPQLHSLQDTARAGLFPGLKVGISDTLNLLPQVQQIVANIAHEMGNLAAEAGKGLSGDSFKAFFNYLQTDAASTLEQFGHTLGNVAQGIANLFVGFAPLTRDFNSGLERMSASFAHWTAGLSQTQGFHDFLDYIRESGPAVLNLIGSLSSALAGIVKAAAPMGQVVVAGLTAVADVLGAIANSPIGPVFYTAAAGMLVLNRAANLTELSMVRFGASAETASLAAGRLGTAFGTAGLALGGLYVLDKMQRQFEGLSTSTKSLTGQLLALSQAGAGAKLSGEFKDISDSFDRLADPNRAQALQDSLNGWLGTSDSRFDRAKAQIEAIDTALQRIATTRGTGAAQRSFKALAESMHLSGSEQRKLLSMLPQYRGALAGSASANARQASSLRHVADAAGHTRAELQGLIGAMHAQRQAALGAFDAETQWRQAMKAAAAQARHNNAGIQGNSKAVLANRGALSQLAAAWNNQSRAVKNSESKYQAARGALINTAVQMGVTRAAAERLANRILDIPKSHVTQISLTGSDEALNKLAQIKAQAASIPRSISTTYYVNQVNRINRPSVPTPGQTPYDTGGFTGVGGKYEPAGIVHRGEVVIPAEETKRDWAMLKSRYGYLPGFAAGGVAGQKPKDPHANWTPLLPGDPGFAGLTHAAHGLKNALEDSRKSLAKEKAQRDALVQARGNVVSGVKDGLRTDLFAAPSDVWSKAASANPFAILRGDIKQADRFRGLTNKLKHNGLGGKALGDLLATGDVSTVASYASMSKKNLALYEQLYNRRDRVLASAGRAAGNAAYGKQIEHLAAVMHEQGRDNKAIKTHLAHIEHELKHGHPEKTGAAVGKSLNSSAAAAYRRGN